MSREFRLNILAGVLARGDETKVGGEACECEWSAVAKATTSFLEPEACWDDVRMRLSRELDRCVLFLVPTKKLCAELITYLTIEGARGAA